LLHNERLLTGVISTVNEYEITREVSKKTSRENEKCEQRKRLREITREVSKKTSREREQRAERKTSREISEQREREKSQGSEQPRRE
jgi:hypothetical protein